MTIQEGIELFTQHREQLIESRSVMDNVADGNEYVTVNGKTRHLIGYLEDFLFLPGRKKLRRPGSHANEESIRGPSHSKKKKNLKHCRPRSKHSKLNGTDFIKPLQIPTSINRMEAGCRY